jgi:hypothetical protein
VNQTNGTITLPFTGRYLLTLNLEAISRNVSPFRMWQTLYVAPGGGARQSRWIPYAWRMWEAIAHRHVGPFCAAILELTAGDVLTLATDESASDSANKARAVLFMLELLLG